MSEFMDFLKKIVKDDVKMVELSPESAAVLAPDGSAKIISVDRPKPTRTVLRGTGGGIIISGNSVYIDNGIEGNGIPGEISGKLKPAKHVFINIPGAVISCGGRKNGYKITGDENILPFVKVEQVGDTVRFKLTGNVSTSEAMILELNLSSIPQSLSLSGSTFAKLNGCQGDQIEINLKGSSLLEAGDAVLKNAEFAISGASTFTFAGEVGQCRAKIWGASGAKLDGNMKDLILEVSGASNCLVENAETVILGCSGASSVKIHATESLSGRVSGASDVRYSGVKYADLNCTGASSIKRQKS